MKVFRYNSEIEETKYVEYPRPDMGEIEGLDSNIIFYIVEDEDKPDYDTDIEELEYSVDITDEYNETYPAIRKAVGSWVVVDKELDALETIQANLKEDLKEVILEMGV